MRIKAIAATVLAEPRNGKCKFHLATAAGSFAGGTGVPPVCSRQETYGKRDARATYAPSLLHAGKRPWAAGMPPEPEGWKPALLAFQGSWPQLTSLPPRHVS